MINRKKNKQKIVFNLLQIAIGKKRMKFIKIEQE